MLTPLLPLHALRKKQQQLTTYQQVQLLEDEGGRFHLRNLSAHRVATEEEALNLVRCCWCVLLCALRVLASRVMLGLSSGGARNPFRKTHKQKQTKR